MNFWKTQINAVSQTQHLNGRMRDAAIYVVDDDQGVRESICSLLASYGFAVVGFASGDDCLGHVQRPRPSCLVLDMHMPGMTGLELLRRMREGSSAVPAILITGRPDPSIRIAADRAGATVLAKPFAADLLVSSIQQVLRE